jgi:Ras-related protein Rab-18
MQVKVIFVGSAGVGKTCLVHRVFHDRFDTASQPTIGARESERVSHKM